MIRKTATKKHTDSTGKERITSCDNITSCKSPYNFRRVILADILADSLARVCFNSLTQIIYSFVLIYERIKIRDVSFSIVRELARGDSVRGGF